MTSQLQGEMDQARARPVRVSVIVILATLIFADAALRVMSTSTVAPAQPRSQHPMPSACGSEAVARAQHEIDRAQRPSVTVLS